MGDHEQGAGLLWRARANGKGKTSLCTCKHTHATPTRSSAWQRNLIVLTSAAAFQEVSLRMIAMTSYGGFR